MEYQTLVDLITREVMAALSSNPTPAAVPSSKKHAVIFIDSPLNEESAFFLKLAKLNGFSLTLLGKPEWEALVARKAPGLTFRFIDWQAQPVNKLLESADLILCLNPSLQTLAGIAGLTGGNPVGDGFIEALQLGKSLQMDLSRFTSLFKLSANLPQGFLAKIKALLATIQSYEIKDFAVTAPQWLHAETIPSLRQENKKCVVTQEDISQYLALGEKTLKFPRGSIITPLAKEELNTRGIEIIFE